MNFGEPGAMIAACKNAFLRQHAFMTESPYPDFELTADNCDVEPIHRPMFIQGRGHMLVFERDTPSALRAMSSGASELFGLSPEPCWATPTEDWLPASLWTAIQAIGRNPGARQKLIPVELAGAKYDAILHAHAGRSFIEFEPAPENSVNFRTISDVAQVLRECRSLDSLFEVAARELSEVLGFDRVMVYRFDDDNHGCVVGESKRPDLEAFFGLHYPASDIPQLARDLFLLTPVRLISDVQSASHRLLLRPGAPASWQHIDQTYCHLRATSPVHVEYLDNMGVRATLTIAITVNGRLWGLFACHHYAPKLIPFELRLVCESISESFSKQLLELQLLASAAEQKISRRIEAELLNELSVGDHYRINILQNSEALSQLCPSDGVAIVTLDDCEFATGLTPNPSELLAIRDWLSSTGNDEVFHTHRFSENVAVNGSFADRIGGMLSSCISPISGSYIFWFRHPQTQTTDWAGDPSKSLIVEEREDDSPRVRPRKSFEKWKVVVDGQSLPWSTESIEMADRVRQAVLKKELRRTATLVENSNREFMQLASAASHDLQEPLRTQLNYLEVLAEEIAELSRDDLNHYLGRASNAVSRMQALISDLLSYSMLNAPQKKEPVDLHALISNIEQDLRSVIETSATEISVAELPVMYAEPNKMAALLQNLITNAIKYVAPGVNPKVKLRAAHEGEHVTLFVEDNGIGIEPQYRTKIFEMFERLHNADEYSGTGIGLAICKKIAEAMDADIGVQPSPDNGSTFFIRFHESMTQVPDA